MLREGCQAKSCGKTFSGITKCGKYKEPEAEKSLEGRKSKHRNLKAMQSYLEFILNAL